MNNSTCWQANSQAILLDAQLRLMLHAYINTGTLVDRWEKMPDVTDLLEIACQYSGKLVEMTEDGATEFDNISKQVSESKKWTVFQGVVPEVNAEGNHAPTL